MWGGQVAGEPVRMCACVCGVGKELVRRLHKYMARRKYEGFRRVVRTWAQPFKRCVELLRPATVLMLLAISIARPLPHRAAQHTSSLAPRTLYGGIILFIDFSFAPQPSSNLLQAGTNGIALLLPRAGPGEVTPEAATKSNNNK